VLHRKWLCVGLSSLAAPFSLAAPALADEPSPSLKGTVSTSVVRNSDNRSRARSVPDFADDDWTLVHTRSELEGSSGSARVVVRVDHAWFPAAPTPTRVALNMAAAAGTPGEAADASYFERRVYDAGTELSNRYVSWAYPAKYRVEYTARDWNATVGDFYATLGRGLVLSVRRMDELASDTTIRGVRIRGRARNILGLELQATALAGELNPLRIDDASGRFLGVTDDVTPGVLAVTEAGMPRALATDFSPEATATYAPDRLLGGQFEIDARGMKLGTQGSALLRQRPLSNDWVRTARSVLTLSQSLTVPRIAGAGQLYAEAALQRLEHPAEFGTERDGHALYASFSIVQGPLTVVAEGKHNRRFFPLLANVDVARAREFAYVQYSTPPTTLPIWADYELGAFSTCVTGGRISANLAVSRAASLAAWVGEYDSWAESVPNERCDTRDENRNRAWDVAAGGELSGASGRRRVTWSVGTRVDDATRPLGADRRLASQAFYRELYSRYEAVLPLSGPMALHFTGFNRRRREALAEPFGGWSEGEQALTLEWVGLVSTTLGLGYTTHPRVPPTYLCARLFWRLSSRLEVGTFIGQRRGALRCVAGTCRFEPAFEGGRLEVLLRL
jgi:hypothetical protein